MKITKEKIKPIVFLLSFTAIIIFIWFRNGLTYGGGDVGLPTFNPQITLKIISNIWWESSAPGFPRPNGISGIPFYVIFSLIQYIFNSPFFIQVIEFWMYLTLMGIGMYLLSKDIFGQNKILALISSIYYMINPFMMIQVWHRFTHTLMLFAALLPFIFFCWKRWIDSGSKKYLLFFSILNTYGSIIFSTLGHIIVLWTILGLYSFYTLFIPIKSIENFKIYFKRFLFGFIIWVGVSIWWFMPVFTTAPNVFSRQHSLSDTLSTLISLANQSILPYTIQGINPFYLYDEMDWGVIYDVWYFKLIPFLLVGIGLVGFLYSLGDKKLIFWGLLFVVTLFLSKGAAPPFSSIFTFLFERFFILGVLRNPFEKIGVLIPLSFAILIPLGISFLYRLSLKFRFSKIYILLIVVILNLNFFVWSWPYWFGRLFGSEYNRRWVEVPNYYKQANSWITNQKKTGRILHLPINVTEATSYKWEYGYQGLEPNHLFFTSNPSLSQGFNLEPLDSILETFQEALKTSNIFDIERLKELFGWFNIRFVVLHLDMNSNYIGADNPIRVQMVINRLPFLKYKETFGKLVIFEVNEDIEGSLVYLATSADYIDYIYLGKDNLYWPWVLKDNQRILISKKDNPQSKEVDNLLESAVFVPQTEFISEPLYQSFDESIFELLPPIKYLPNDPLYRLIRAKELLEIYSLYGKERVIKQINLASKRLVEAIKVKRKESKFNRVDLIKEYKSDLEIIFPKLSQGFPTERSFVNRLFSQHLLLLEQIWNYSNYEAEKKVISDTQAYLKTNLALLGLHAYYESNNKNSQKATKVFGFNIPQDDDYEVILGYQRNNPIDRNLTLEIDGSALNPQKLSHVNILNADSRIKDLLSPNDNPQALVSLARSILNKGYHEISYKVISEDVKTTDWRSSEQGQFEKSSDGIKLISSKNEPIFIETSLDNFVPGQTYLVEFEYWVQSGNGPKFQVLQDSDSQIKGKRRLHVDKSFATDNYYRFWRKASISFEPRLTTYEVKLRLLLEPWDDCKEITAHNVELCEQVEFKKKFQRPSEIILRNIKISRLIEPAILLKKASSKTVPSYKKVDAIRESPDKVKGKFTLEKPSFLVFSESYDSDWKLSLTSNNKDVPVKEKVLVNLFANSWYLDKPGVYEFEIEYTPQKLIMLGGIVSASTYGYLIFYLKRKNDS